MTARLSAGLTVLKAFQRGFYGRSLLIVAAALAAAALVWLGYLWLRDVSLVRVKEVEITGVSGREAPAIERALRQTAERMTTLHVREGELLAAVDSFPAVRSLSASADFPNKLEIEVVPNDPVAVLVTSAGRHVAVAGDGTLLGSARPRARLPAVRAETIPTSRRLERGPERVLVAVLAGAPAKLRPLLERAYGTRQGVRVAIADGPRLYFGRPSRIAAKWAAAARVLADPSSRGAHVIDLRLPERPAARFDDGPDDEASGSATGEAPPSSTSTSAASATAGTATLGTTGAEAVAPTGATGPDGSGAEAGAVNAQP